MLDTIGRYLQGLANVQDGYFLSRVIDPVADRCSSQPLTSAGLVINAGGAAYPKTGAATFYAVAGGTLVSVAAGTALPALTGINATVAAPWVIAAFFVDSAGNLTVAGGNPGATLGAVTWPQFPQKKSLIGFAIIYNAAGFTGGTTALDAGTTVYISPLGAFDPTVLL